MVILPEKDISKDFSLVLYKNATNVVKYRISFSQNVFSFLIDGYKTIYAQASKTLSHDEFALITSPCCLMTEKVSSPDRQYVSLLFFFSNKALKEFYLKYQKKIDTLKKDNLSLSDVVTFPYDTFCTIFRDSLLQIYSQDGTSKDDMLEMKFSEIMLYLMENYPDRVLSILRNCTVAREMKFREIIENNIYHNLRIEDLAFLCNMSISTFKRHFKQYYHQPPQNYILTKRMSLARVLIENGERPVEVYSKVGYQTQSNFTKAYKAHYGSPPAKSGLK